MPQDGDGQECGLAAAISSVLGLEERDVKENDRLAFLGVDTHITNCFLSCSDSP